MPYYEVEQLSSAGELHYHIELFLGLDDFIKLDDVRVPHLFQNFDFSGNSLYVLLVVNLVFLQYLDGHLLAGQGVLA